MQLSEVFIPVELGQRCTFLIFFSNIFHLRKYTAQQPLIFVSTKQKREVPNEI